MLCVCQHNNYCNKDKMLKLCGKEDYEKETGRKILTSEERQILRDSKRDFGWYAM